MNGLLIRDATPGSETRGQWLLRFDPDAHDGLGQAWWTPVKDKALIFDGLEMALDLWRRRSTVRPVRWDGRPNRPLTAHTITFDVAAPGR